MRKFKIKIRCVSSRFKACQYTYILENFSYSYIHTSYVHTIIFSFIKNYLMSLDLRSFSKDDDDKIS